MQPKLQTDHTNWYEQQRPQLSSAGEQPASTKWRDRDLQICPAPAAPSFPLLPNPNPTSRSRATERGGPAYLFSLWKASTISCNGHGGPYSAPTIPIYVLVFCFMYNVVMQPSLHAETFYRSTVYTSPCYGVVPARVYTHRFKQTSGSNDNPARQGGALHQRTLLAGATRDSPPSRPAPFHAGCV